MRILWFLALCTILVSCTDRSYSPTVPEALEIGTSSTVFAATNRLPEDNGNYGFRRSENLRLLELTVSIPPEHEPGTLKFGYSNPKPAKQFTMAGRKEFSSSQEFRKRLNNEMNSLPSQDREVVVFVHGYNATQAETAFRAAQLSHDLALPGAMVIYSWPSKGKALAYAYDADSVLFARDGLEQLLRGLKSSGVQRIVLAAHSIGSLLTMETLRQIEIKDPNWAAENLGGVVLISPDLDIEIFRTQMERMETIPQPFVIFVSDKDKALNLSSRLRGNYKPQRLGNLSHIDQISDFPVEVIDTTAFAKNASSTHFIPATSPALIAMLNGARSMNDTFGSEDRTVESLLTGVDVRQGGASEIILRPVGESPR